MNTIQTYTHRVASHCESGTIRNLLNWAGTQVSEPMVFGTGSGPAFFYLFFVNGPSGFPLIGVRNPPGSILKNLQKRWYLDLVSAKYRTTEAAFAKANALIDAGIPVAAAVDMFYMTYLPKFLHIHAPFHFIALVGRDSDSYAVSDPYFEEIGILDKENLRAAWSTHATMAKDNFLCYLNPAKTTLDYRRPALAAIDKTCKGMLLPPFVRNVFSFVGVEGMRMFAKKIPTWPDKYRGAFLREGILFTAVGFEDQGTGGGAFRPMYGAFLHELAELLFDSSIRELAAEMVAHGQQWREVSRLCIKVGKKIPIDDAAYADWLAAGDNAKILRDGLAEISARFGERANFEENFFKRLKQAARAVRI